MTENTKASPGDSERWPRCVDAGYDIPTEEARTLATTLDDAGVEEYPHRSYDGSEVTYVVSKPPGEDFSDAGIAWITLTVWPMLPHGVPALTGA